MRKILFVRTPVLALAATIIPGCLPAAAGAEVLALDSYLAQVAAGNPQLAASRATAQGMPLKALEPCMAYSPMVFGSLNRLDDRREAIGITSPSRTLAESWNVGLSKKWSTGTVTELSYGLDYMHVFFPASAPGSPFSASLLFPETSWYAAKPSFTVRQSLLRDFLGGITNAGVEKVRHGAAAGERGEEYRAQGVMLQAEQAYWALAVARATLAFKQDSLERTKRLRDWTERRVNLSLTDRDDLLQADAALGLRELDLRMARQAELAARQAFNTARGRSGDEVPEELEGIPPGVEAGSATPAMARDRLDVQACAEALESARQAARETSFRSLPDVSAFGTVALNGHSGTLNGANDKSGQADWPTYMVGVVVQAPLDVFTLGRVRKGFDSDLVAAQAALRGARLGQDQDWSQLRARHADILERLALARQIVELQRSRLAGEQARYQNGRITTYQLLTAEEDYSTARLTELQMGFERLMVEAQARLFNGEYRTSGKETAQ